MTVGELIDTLEKFPKDIECFSSGMHIESCYLQEEFYDGDYANPNCPVIKAVVIE